MKMLVAILSMLILAGTANAFLVSFSGTVEIDNQTAPAGVVVGIYNNTGELVLQRTTFQHPTMNYILDFNSDETTGNVFFKVAGVNANQGLQTIGNKTIIYLNLSINSLPDGEACEYDIACSSKICVDGICRPSGYTTTTTSTSTTSTTTTTSTTILPPTTTTIQPTTTSTIATTTTLPSETTTTTSTTLPAITTTSTTTSTIPSCQLNITSYSKPSDTETGNTANAVVNITNTGSLGCYGFVQCDFKDPSGDHYYPGGILSCTLFETGSTKTFYPGMVVDEIGTWNVSSCSVYSSFESNCSTNELQDIAEPIGTFDVFETTTTTTAPSGGGGGGGGGGAGSGGDGWFIQTTTTTTIPCPLEYDISIPNELDVYTNDIARIPVTITMKRVGCPPVDVEIKVDVPSGWTPGYNLVSNLTENQTRTVYVTISIPDKEGKYLLTVKAGSTSRDITFDVSKKTGPTTTLITTTTTMSAVTTTTISMLPTGFAIAIEESALYIILIIIALIVLYFVITRFWKKKPVKKNSKNEKL